MNPRLICLVCIACAAFHLGHSTTYVVSVVGDDSAVGSAAHPFRTIQKAADVAAAGDIVQVDDGLYREAVALRNSGTSKAPIQFVAIHPGLATVTGADPIYDWKRVPGDAPIYATTWDHVFAIDWKNGKPIEHHPETEPLWGRAEQVISDGKQLLPTLGLDGLKKAWSSKTSDSILPSPLPHLGGPFSGSFAVDTAAKKLYVWLADGSDPNKHTMLGSTRSQIFGVNQWEKKEGVSYVQVKGFRFVYGATFPQRPAVSLYGSQNLVEDCLIEQMSGCGVGVSGTLRSTVITGCGQTGGSAYGDGFLNDSNAWISNSWKPIDRGWEAGGVKQGATKNGIFKHCLFRRNGGPGLWLDVWVHDVQINHCVFQENEGCGLFVEISHDIKADHNLAIGNATGVVGKEASWSDGGMVMAESMGCEFTNNTCIANQDGICFREQGPRDNDTDTGHIAFHDARDTITHNLLVNNRQFQLGMWFDNPFFGRHPADNAKYPSEEAFSEYIKSIPGKVYDPAKQNLTIDANVYFPQSSVEKAALYGVPWRPRSHQFDHLADFTKATGFEEHGKEVTDDATGAGWAEAPSDIDTWIRRSLSPWLKARI